LRLLGSAASAVVLVLVLGPASVQAATVRLAVVVGNNTGGGSRAPLHFAETDAGKLGRVLVEIGGHRPENVLLLQGRSLAEIERALAEAAKRVRSLQQSGDRVVLLFYFSGHSDGTALELGRDRLDYARLNDWLDKTRAEIRLAIVDSCMSGALIEPKGARPGAGFELTLSDELTSSGRAVLTSSAANELALESREIGGSFFTHHLVSGLRGAADASGDGRGTLTEGYQYAFARTVSATAGTFAGGQHPTYDFQLSGQGELVLTELVSPRNAWIELPEGFERALVVQIRRDQVVGELPTGAVRRLALEPGGYLVRAWKGERVFAARLDAVAGTVRSVTWTELRPVSQQTLAKGGWTEEPWARRSLSLGGSRGVAEGLTVAPAGRIALRLDRWAGAALAVDVSTGRGDGLRESTVLAFGAVRARFEIGPLRPFAGVEAGGGLIYQSLEGGDPAWSGAAGGGPWVGAELQSGRGFGITVDGHVPLLAGRKDGAMSLLVLPAVTAGLSIEL